MNTLPAELLDQVIAHAAQSTSDRTRGRHAANLSSCCLVSRRFREAAEPVLYSTIFLENLSNAPALLLKTLASRPHLAEIVKELFIECAAPCATPVQQVYQLRDFLEGALGLLVNLRSLGSNHRVVTTKLVEATLYKRGSGYSMSIPTELGNVRTLELFAADYIYKYNYILRLPQLRRVVLHSAKIIDYDIEDAAFPDDWGWTSSSIKELVLHQGYRHLSSMAMRLRARSLRALSSSMPCLEYIRLYHFECNLFPRQSRHLLAFFAPQLQSSLRQLIIQDGRIDARYPEIGPNYLTDDGMAALADIKTSRLEVLSIDVHILFDTIHNMSLVETINAASLPAALRHLHLRYVEANDMSSVGDTNTMLSWNCNDVAGQIKSKCPLLESINLELRLLKTPDNIAIERYIIVLHQDARLLYALDVRDRLCHPHFLHVKLTISLNRASVELPWTIPDICKIFLWLAKTDGTGASTYPTLHIHAFIINPFPPDETHIYALGDISVRSEVNRADVECPARRGHRDVNLEKCSLL